MGSRSDCTVSGWRVDCHQCEGMRRGAISPTDCLSPACTATEPCVTGGQSYQSKRRMRWLTRDMGSKAKRREVKRLLIDCDR